jgi:hypothetical protein
MEILVLPEEKETGKAISTEQIWKIAVLLHATLQQSIKGGGRKTSERNSHRTRRTGEFCKGNFVS